MGAGPFSFWKSHWSLAKCSSILISFLSLLVPAPLLLRNRTTLSPPVPSISCKRRSTVRATLGIVLAFAAQADVEGFAQVASLFALHHHLASCVMSADLRWRRGTSCAAWYAATRKRITSQSSK